jgi:hypothetical protein
MEITKKIVSRRIADYTKDNYLYIYGLIKGVALATAAFVLLTFLKEPVTILPRLVLWLAILGTLLISLIATARGVILTGSNSNLLDTFTPIGGGFFEFLLFAFLQPINNFPQLWIFWYVVWGLHAFTASIMVSNRISLTKLEDYEKGLHPLIMKYINWLKQDFRGSLTSGFVSIIVWVIVCLVGIHLGHFIVYVTGSLIIVMSIIVTLEVEKQRKAIYNFINNY